MFGLNKAKKNSIKRLEEENAELKEDVKKLKSEIYVLNVRVARLFSYVNDEPITNYDIPEK